jgi:hypothetical protein
MKPWLAIGVPAAVLVGGIATVWAAGWGPFGSQLDTDDRAVVDAVEQGEPSRSPHDAAAFVQDNVDLLLSADVGDAVDGSALADLFDTAFRDDASASDLLTAVVDGVAREGDIHQDALHPTLADATAGNMAWFDERIQAAASDPSADAGRDYLAAHDFLREVASHGDAAAILQQGVYDYGLAQTAAAPDSGGQRAERLKDLGRVQAVFLEAQTNADKGQAAGDDRQSMEPADEADGERRQQALEDRAAWLAFDLYESDPAVRDLAHGQPFVDADGALKDEMTDREVQAFREWAVATVVGDDTTQGPAYDDEDLIGAGAQEMPLRAEIEDRY